jgi:hypothetical protein
VPKHKTGRGCVLDAPFNYSFVTYAGNQISVQNMYKEMQEEFFKRENKTLLK